LRRIASRAARPVAGASGSFLRTAAVAIANSAAIFRCAFCPFYHHAGKEKAAGRRDDVTRRAAVRTGSERREFG